MSYYRLLTLFLISFLAAAEPLFPHDRLARTAAGIVEKQLESEYEAKPLEPFPELPALVLDLPDETLDICDDETLYVRSIKLIGHSAIEEGLLLDICTSYTNRNLTIGEINQLCTALQALYVRKGFFLARAFAPEQEIFDNELVIKIVEGNLGSIEVAGNCYYSSRYIASHFAHMQGKPIQYDALMFVLLLLNENDNLNAKVIFRKGLCPGTADLIIQASDCRPVHFYADTNNYGINAISRQRYAAKFGYGNLIFNGDMLTIAEVTGRRPDLLTFTDVIYSFPINTRGTFLEFSYVTNQFKAPHPRHLKIHGSSRVAEASLSQALVRTRTEKVDGFITFDYEQFKNKALHHLEWFDKLRVLTLALKRDALDAFCGRSIAELSLRLGIPKFLGGLHSVDRRCSREGAGGKYTIFSGNYLRIQHFPRHRQFFLFNLTGQYTGNKLPLAEQFYIGGFDTVRGFPMAERIGDCGYYMNAEFHFPLPRLEGICVRKTDILWNDILQMVAFVDYGAVSYNGRLKRKGKVVESKNHFSLTGAGVGVRLVGPWNTSLTIDVGFPLNHCRHVPPATLYFKLAFEI